MREIKFRGKRVDNGEWVYGYLINNCDSSSVIVTDYHIGDGYDGEQELWSYDWHKAIPETVGQFTGLKDKNGIEIYEGDVLDMLESAFNNKLVVVKYDEEFAYFYPFGNGNYSEDADEVEVIGNIHNQKEKVEE